VRREHLQVLARATPYSVRENILVDVENIEGDCSSPSDTMTKTPGSELAKRQSHVTDK
jgi:hypothetical protein